MEEHFSFGGFQIPERLALKTGGGGESFERISTAHFASIDLYFEISQGAAVLELGCGVGRDAIPLIGRIGEFGRYLGTDIDRETIEWCQQNIGKRHPNFRFELFDIQNEWYNVEGRFQVRDCPIPADDESFDLVILQSVFTHLPEEDIAFYLGEFSRLLRPGGVVYSTFFLLDEETLERISNSTFLTFQHSVGEGAWIHDADNPSFARGYSVEKVRRLIDGTTLEVEHGPFYGSWSGRAPTARVDTGQDLLVFRKSSG